MTDVEKMASNIAVAMNGGEWKDGKWYSEGHRKAWINAVQPYADEINHLRSALREIKGIGFNDHASKAIYIAYTALGEGKE